MKHLPVIPKATFKLKCLLCGKKESRPAEDCRGEAPVCSKCYGPMLLITVSVKNAKT